MSGRPPRAPQQVPEGITPGISVQGDAKNESAVAVGTGMVLAPIDEHLKQVGSAGLVRQRGDVLVEERLSG